MVFNLKTNLPPHPQKKPNKQTQQQQQQLAGYVSCTLMIYFYIWRLMLINTFHIPNFFITYVVNSMHFSLTTLAWKFICKNMCMYEREREWERDRERERERGDCQFHSLYFEIKMLLMLHKWAIGGGNPEAKWLKQTLTDDNKAQLCLAL